MLPDAAKSASQLARDIQASIDEALLPPPEVVAPGQQPIIPHTLVANTRGYIAKIVHQINASYTATCYDGCAVMIRRLIEVLIIEAFEHHKLRKKILDANGDYLYLADLIKAVVKEPTWQLNKPTRKAFGKKQFKAIGDLSAHSRNYNAQRQYIDELVQDLRVLTEDLLYIADLR